MTRHRTRVVALLAALMLLLSAAALAEAPAFGGRPRSRIEQIFESGRAIRLQGGLTVDAEALSVLAVQGATDEGETAAMVGLFAAILSKLRGTALMTPQAYDLSVGTWTGELFNLRAAANPETSELLLSTSLLPGLSFSVDPGVLGAQLPAMELFKGFSEADLQMLLAPYLETIDAYMKQLPTPEREEGSFEIPGEGSFDAVERMDLNKGQALGLYFALLERFKTDTRAQDFLRQILSAAAEMEKNSETPVPQVEEIIAQAEDALKEALGEEDALVGRVILYSRADAVYEEITFLNAGDGDDSDGFFVSIFAQPAAGEEGGLLRLNFLTGDKGGESEWRAVREKVLSGENHGATLLVLDLRGGEDAAAERRNLHAGLTLYGNGLFGANLTADWSCSTGDSFLAEGTLALSLSGPNPLLTLDFRAEETDELPVPPETEGKRIALDPESAQEALPDILAALMGPGLGGLLERLDTALPEEADMIKGLLSALMPSQETGPEPSTSM